MRKQTIKATVSMIISIIISVALFLIYSYVSDNTAFKQNIFYKYDDVPSSIAISILILVVSFNFYFIIYFFNSIKQKQYNVLDIIPQSIIIYSIMGKVIFANKFACDKFGVDQKDSAGESILNFVTESNKGRVINDTKDFISSKDNIITNNYTMITKNGFKFEGVVYVGRFGLTKLIAIVSDNTEIEKIEKIYQNQAEYFWNLLNNIPIPFSYNKPNGDYKFVNKAYQKMFNKTEAKLLNSNIKNVIKIKDYDALEKRHEYVVESHDNMDYDTNITIENKELNININMTPFMSENETKGVFYMIKDITEKSKKDVLLKKETLLNKALNEIAEITSGATEIDINEKVKEALLAVRKILGVCRTYIVFDENGDLYLSHESVEKGLKPYNHCILNIPESHRKFYNKFMKNRNIIKTSNIALSKYAPLKHLKILNAKSVLEVSLPGTNVNEKNAMICAATVLKYKKWTKQEVDFLTSAGKIILNTIDRINHIKNLRLSEETLNTLIDNTDIGIIISDEKGNVFYSNKRFTDMFGNIEDNLNNFVLNEIVDPEDLKLFQSLFNEREYKGFAGGTIQCRDKNKHKLYLKTYSSRIDYEGNKAYLTTFVDVTDYKN